MTSQRKSLLLAVAASVTALIVVTVGRHHSAPRPTVSSLQTITVDGVSRTYLLHVPAKPQNKAPLMISFHGGGYSPSSWETQTGFSTLSDSQGFIVAYPEWLQPGQNGSGAGSDWTIGCCSSFQEQPDDVDLTNAIIAHLEATNNVDPNRIYVTGFSLGGYLTYRLACQDPLIAGVGVVGAGELLPGPATSSNPVPTSCAPQHPVAVFDIRATNDFYDGSNTSGGGFGSQGYEPSVAQTNQQWRIFDRCTNTSDTTAPSDLDSAQTWASCSNSSQVRQDTLNNVGHCWPTLSGCGNIDAATLFWNFLSQTTLPAVTGVPETPTVSSA